MLAHANSVLYYRYWVAAPELTGRPPEGNKKCPK